MIRNLSAPELNAKKTACKRGHPLSGDNLLLSTHPATGKSMRGCRQCKRDREAARPRSLKPKAMTRAQALAEVARLSGLVEDVRASTIEECARAVDDHFQPGYGCVSQAAAVVLKLLHPSTVQAGGTDGAA